MLGLVSLSFSNIFMQPISEENGISVLCCWLTESN